MGKNVIARNASLLTFRMLLATAVGLFTSRIVLQALGVVDYGIYGVVGGIVALAAFLQNALSGSTSRFLAYAMGQGDFPGLHRCFSTSRALHYILAGVIVVAGEALGLIALNYFLDIPADRMHAARWVLQFSIFQVALTISQIPCVAFIQAKEQMQVYAIAEIINVTLRLVIAYTLLIVSTDKLILYAALNLAVTIFLQGFYQLYCRRRGELDFSLRIHREVRDRLLSFSGLDLFSSFSATLSLQGMNFLVNIFFGVVYNTAVGLGMVVNGAVIGLATTSWQAFRPQIIKQYSAGNIREMETLLRSGSMFSVCAMLLLIIPCLLESGYILQLWLGEIPPHSVDFLRVILIMGFFNNLNYQIATVVQATGEIRNLSVINGLLLLMSPAVAWTGLHYSFPAWSVYCILAGCYIFCSFNAAAQADRLIPELDIAGFGRRTMSVMIAGIICAAVPAAIISLWTEPSFLRLVCTTATFVLVFGTVIWTMFLSKDNKAYLKSLIIK